MMPIANIMRMRKIFYFNISTDSRVKVARVLNNIVNFAQEHYFHLKIAFESLHPLLLSRKWLFLKTKKKSENYTNS